MKKRIVAVVPVRKGSQRVKSKNTRPFGDTSLLELKLKVLQHVDGIDEIVVNTDCDVSIAMAEKYGASIHKRDAHYTSSMVTNDQHWKHIAETTDTDILMMAQTTSPMVRASTYQEALDLFLNGKNSIDSVNSVTPEKKFLWQEGAPINYHINATPKSQDLPDIVSLNFAITIIERDLMIARKNVVGRNPGFIVLGRMESVDVDEEIDFEFAEFLYQKHGFGWLLN